MNLSVYYLGIQAVNCHDLQKQQCATLYVVQSELTPLSLS